jgi:hypothetical protein
VSPTLIAAAVAATIIAGLGAYAWDADRALRREHDRAEAATMQRDAYAKGLTQCRLDVAERNRTLAGMTALPEVRKRLCAQRGAADACCKPAPAECVP